MNTDTKMDATEERIVAEVAAMADDTKKRRIAVTILNGVEQWPDPHDPEFLTYIANAPTEEKQAALCAAIDVGIASADTDKLVTGTPEELMARVHARHEMVRNPADE